MILSEFIQNYLSTYFSKNKISQSFSLNIKDSDNCTLALDLVFAEGPLEGKVLSFSDNKYKYGGKALAVISEMSRQMDVKFSHYLIEDSFVLCTEALLMQDYAVFDPMDRAIHRSRWYLQNKFIPNLVDCVSSGYLPALALESGKEWWENIERDYDMRLNLGPGFYCNKLEIKEGYVIYFYNFPQPSAVGEALYGAVVVNKTTLSAEYYKLELNFDYEWFICGQTLSKHQIFGKSKSRDRSEFLNWVLNRIG